MTTRLDSVVIDAADPARVGRFWADALGWTVLGERSEAVVVGVPGAPPWGEGGPMTLVVVPVAEPKTIKNRVHLDLASASETDQQATVARVTDLGASRTDVGQEDVPWVVMADPEGNEFCVLDARDAYRDVGPVAAVLIDCADPIELANFWIKATGWPAVRYTDQFVCLQHPRHRTAAVELLMVPDPKTVKNRVHIDVVPTAGGDTAVEVARLERAGGRPVDVGQRDVSWTVMADPEGNELCVLPPARDA